MASLGDWVRLRHGENTTVAAVPIRTLDDFTTDEELPKPDLLKVDVEGNELRVFQGARSILEQENAPIIVFEMNVFAAPAATGGFPASAALDFLLDLSKSNYSCFVIHDWGLLTRMKHGQIHHGNVLAIPAGRIDRWPALASADFAELIGP